MTVPRETKLSDVRMAELGVRRWEDVLDIRKQPTGWKIKSEHDGTRIVDPRTGRSVVFPIENTKSGSEALRRKIEARHYAVDHAVNEGESELSHRWYITSGKDGSFWTDGAWSRWPRGVSYGYSTSEAAWAAVPTQRASGHRRREIIVAKYGDAVIERMSRKESNEARYGGDPRWIQAKYAGQDKHGTAFKKGERVLYYPNGKHIIAGERAEQAWREFLSAAGDEMGMPYAESFDEAHKGMPTAGDEVEDVWKPGRRGRVFSVDHATGDVAVTWSDDKQRKPKRMVWKVDIDYPRDAKKSVSEARKRNPARDAFWDKVRKNSKPVDWDVIAPQRHPTGGGPRVVFVSWEDEPSRYTSGAKLEIHATVWRKDADDDDVAKAETYARTQYKGRVHIGNARTTLDDVRAAHFRGISLGAPSEAVVEGLRGEGAREGHQLRIALSTLKMNRVFGHIMGGMNHAQAVALLLKSGYTEQKIRSMLKGHGHADADIDAMFGKAEGIEEALDLRVVYEKAFYAAQARLAGEMQKAVKLDREIDRLATQFERAGQADEVLAAEELGRQDADGNDEPRAWSVVKAELESMTSESVDEMTSYKDWPWSSLAELTPEQVAAKIKASGLPVRVVQKVVNVRGSMRPVTRVTLNGATIDGDTSVDSHTYDSFLDLRTELNGTLLKGRREPLVSVDGRPVNASFAVVTLESADEGVESRVFLTEALNIPFNSEHEIRDPKSYGRSASDFGGAPPTIKVPALRLARATVFMPGSMFGNWNKVEVNDLVVYKAPYAQYAEALHVQFRAKGKRKTVGRAEGSHPRLVVFEGWGIDLDPESMWNTPTRDDKLGVEIKQSRRSGFDKGWDEEMQRRVQAYAKKPVLAIFEGLEEARKFEGEEGSAEELIRVGDRVTIRTPQGQTRTGRAVMQGPHGWVLNMGGAHGTPGIASDSNIASIKRGGKMIFYDYLRSSDESAERVVFGVYDREDTLVSIWNSRKTAHLRAREEGEADRSAGYRVKRLSGGAMRNAIKLLGEPKDHADESRELPNPHLKMDIGTEVTGKKLYGSNPPPGPGAKPKLKSEKPWFLVKEGDKLRAGQSTEAGAQRYMKPGRTLVRGKMQTWDYDGIPAQTFVPESVSSHDPVVEAFNASLRKKLRAGGQDARYARMLHKGKRKVVRGLKKVVAKVRADLEPNDLLPGALESLDEVTKGTAEVFTMLLSSYLTQYDQQQQKRALKRRGGYHSPHALGLYFKALDDVRTAVGPDLQSDSKDAIAKLEAAVRDAFDENFPPVKKLLKATAAFIATGKLPTLKQEFREDELEEAGPAGLVGEVLDYITNETPRPYELQSEFGLASVKVAQRILDLAAESKGPGGKGERWAVKQISPILNDPASFTREKQAEMNPYFEAIDEAKSSVKVGDRVAYKASFLRSIGSFTGLGHLRGRVVKLEKFGQAQLATIEWENGDAPDRVLAPNLSVVSPERGIADESEFIDLLNGTYLHPEFGIVDEANKERMLAEGLPEVDESVAATVQHGDMTFGYDPNTGGPGKGSYWWQKPKGARNVGAVPLEWRKKPDLRARVREKFRYTLRNELNLPGAIADKIIRDIDSKIAEHEEAEA